MREETGPFATVLGTVTARLERAGGMPLSDAVLHLHAIRRFLESCAACGAERELMGAMGRAGVGDMVEALLPLAR